MTSVTHSVLFQRENSSVDVTVCVCGGGSFCCADAEFKASIGMADVAAVEGGVEQKPRVHVLPFAADTGQSDHTLEIRFDQL